MSQPFSPSSVQALNLLFVGPYPPRHGGTAVSLVQLTTALHRRGHRIRVLAPITPEHRDFDRTFVPGLPGIRLTRYLVPYFLYIYDMIPFDEHYRRIEQCAIGRRLPALIQAERPDVVVAGQEPLAWYVPQIARAHGLPCVLLLRGTPTSRIVDGSFPPEHGRPWLEAFRRADRVVTVSRFFEEGLRDRGLSRVCTIQNHVDLGRFWREAKDPTLLERLGIRHGQIVVVHVSKIEPIKRPLDLVAVASKIGQAADLVYVIVGKGPLLAEMKETCRRLMVMDRFRFVGWVPYDRIPGFLNIADMVVQPSEREGLSRVYLEAMACGRTLIASDIPAAREVVRHRENGLLFERGNLDSLAKTISLVANDSALRERIGSGALTSVASHALERMAAEYDRVFREIVASP
jgi:glycosyltransferase involved in cell wall biosynthesis